MHQCNAFMIFKKEGKFIFHLISFVPMDRENIAMFREIVNETLTTDQELKKFLLWGKGDVQQALNYYYRRKDKEKEKVSNYTNNNANNNANNSNANNNRSQQSALHQPTYSTQPTQQSNNAYSMMKIASIKQKRTQEFIKQIRQEYQLPIIKGQFRPNHDSNKTRSSNSSKIFEEADYLPAIFKREDVEIYSEEEDGEEGREESKLEIEDEGQFASSQSFEEKMSKIMQEEESARRDSYNSSNGDFQLQQVNQANEDELDGVDEEGDQQHKLPFKHEPMNVEPEYLDTLDVPELYLGTLPIKAFSLSFMAEIHIAPNTPIQFRSYLQPQKKKKSLNLKTKKQARSMNMRILFANRQIGRLDESQVRVYLPLIEQNIIRLELFAKDVPKRLDMFKRIPIEGRIYLQKRAVTEPVVETFEGHGDVVVKIYKEVADQIRELFEMLQLQVKRCPLIKTKSKYFKPKTEPPPQFFTSKPREISESTTTELSRSITDPFYKAKQKNLTQMMKEKPTATTARLPSLIQSQQTQPTKKIIIEEASSSEDKFKQLIDLYEQDIEPYHPSPKKFQSKLFTYQALALSWMLNRENKDRQQDQELHPLWTEYQVSQECKYRIFLNQLTAQISVRPPLSKIRCYGGILADQMGLGKTVMMAALIASSTPKKSVKNEGKNLVIMPLTLLSQWQNQLKRHTCSLKILIYYSTDRKKYVNDLHNYDVILSTYGTVSFQYSRGFNCTKSGLFKYKWHRIILDQAHYIKGRVIQSAKAIYELNGFARWCLTGTPIQNNLTDLFSLVHFIKYSPWSEYQCWNKYINKPHEMGDSNVYEVLRTILKKVFLRRTKNSKDQNGKSIVELPPRHSSYQILEMSQNQRKFYDKIYESSKASIAELEREGILEAKYMQVFTILMRLRQICCHPILFKSLSKYSKTSQQFEHDLKRFIKKRQELNSKQSEAQNYFQPLIEGDEEVRVEVGGDQKITENYLEKVIRKLKNKEYENCLICLNQISDDDDPVITSCLHIFCKACVVRQLEEGGFCPTCRHKLTKADYLHLPRQNRFNLTEENLSQTFQSTKIIELMAHLNKMEPTDKAVVFSQFLGMLDLIEYSLKRQKITYVRMEGSTSHKQRTRIVNDFQNKKSITVFLVSLKTAGVGLNLVAANKVFMMEPWWNPGVEEQAIERVHRIGQTREVQIVRFIMDKSIETRMRDLNTTKKQLSNTVLNQQTKILTKESKMEKLKYLMANY